jgi:hypothetical protein
MKKMRLFIFCFLLILIKCANIKLTNLVHNSLNSNGNAMQKIE